MDQFIMFTAIGFCLQVQLEPSYLAVALPLLGALAAAKHQHGKSGQQIDVESIPTNHHSTTKAEGLAKVKPDMSKQHNKAEKRKRRRAYLKRKTRAVKTKKAAPAATAPAA